MATISKKSSNVETAVTANPSVPSDNAGASAPAPVVVHRDPSPVATLASWEALSKLSDAELKKLAMAVTAERRSRRLAGKKGAFAEGQRVRMDNAKNKALHGKVGTVVFSQGRTAVVQFGDAKVSVTAKNLKAQP